MEIRALGGRHPSRGEATVLAPGVRMVRSGVGPERARQAALDLLRSGAEALVSWGVAGALTPTLAPGELLLPETVLTPAGGALPVDGDWRARVLRHLAHLDPVGGTLAGVSRVVPDPAAKDRLRESTGAAAVDMETGAVAEAAREGGVPFLAIRAVSDGAQHTLPPAAVSALEPDGGVSLSCLFGGLLRRPGDFIGLLVTARGARAAAAALTRAASELVPVAFLVDGDPESSDLGRKP